MRRRKQGAKSFPVVVAGALLSLVVVGACGSSESDPNGSLVVAGGGAGGSTNQNGCPQVPPISGSACYSSARCPYGAGICGSTRQDATCSAGQWQVITSTVVCTPRPPLPTPGVCPTTIPNPRTPCGVGFVTKALPAPNNPALPLPFSCNYLTPSCGVVTVTCEFAGWSVYDPACLSGAGGAGGASGGEGGTSGGEAGAGAAAGGAPG